MKKKVHPDQLALPIGQGSDSTESYTRWHDERLKKEINWLYNIAVTARRDYERNMPMRSAYEEASRVKHSAWAKIRGEFVSVSQAKAVLGFLGRFRADQCERVRIIVKYCAELRDRGFDTSEIDSFCDMEKCR